MPEYSSVDVGDVERDALEAERLLIQPVSEDAGRYFEIIRFVRSAEHHCKVLLSRNLPGDESANAACLRLKTNEHYWMKVLFSSYRAAFPIDVLLAAKEKDAREHPMSDGDTVASVRWHFDEFVLFYAYGLMITAVWLVFRLYDKKFQVILEVCMPRFALALCLWPVSIWLYPGDPRRQLRDLLRILSMLLSVALSCFSVGVKAAPSGAKKGSEKRDYAEWNVTGYLQGVAIDGVYDHRASIFVKGEFAQGWKATLELGVAHDDWMNGRMLREVSVEKDVPNGTLKFGRFVPVSGWTNPPPFALETIRYPHADPSRGGSFGVQLSRRFGDSDTGHIAITGESGHSFTEPENWDAVELAGRFERKGSPWSWALTGQVRSDVAWSSAEFQYRPAAGDWRMKGVLYGGVREGERFASGYLLTSYALNRHVEAHLMLDHGVDQRDCVTLGATLRPSDDRNFSITFDKDFVLSGGSNDFMIRFRFGF